MNWNGTALCGDADFPAVSSIVDAITPVPGGVGAVTSAVLMAHTVRAAEYLTGGRRMNVFTPAETAANYAAAGVLKTRQPF